MIISASYKTDIPAFYGEWFMNRLRAGYCRMVNPYNQRAIRVDLTLAGVDGFVFWTKNVGPFLPQLDEVAERGYPFMVQVGINGYPRSLEFSVVDAQRSVGHMKVLRGRYGPRAAVWRYDPIVFSSVTPLDFHRRNFAQLARSLAGMTDEVVVSFAQIYKKTRRNMEWAAKQFGFVWEDPADSVKLALAEELATLAQQHGMRLSMCAQEAYLAPGVQAAHCVDGQRLAEIAGHPLAAGIKGNRPDCLCYQSRDIGEYDTCPHGCVYCYAVQNRALAQMRYRAHDPAGEFLFAPARVVDEDDGPMQGTLF